MAALASIPRLQNTLKYRKSEPQNKLKNNLMLSTRSKNLLKLEYISLVFSCFMVPRWGTEDFKHLEEALLWINAEGKGVFLPSGSEMYINRRWNGVLGEISRSYSDTELNC